MKGHSGEWYKYKDDIVEIYPTFTYEIEIYKRWNNGSCLIGNKTYYINRLLNIKKSCIIKKYEDFYIEKYITLIGVPKDFIKDYNLEIYNPPLKIKKSKKK